ncbi:hypothetical protein GF312_01110 [Candidatus Poribacteria bacterium]|nr:hypothetical protein [Candidatus Poribacteria bacterium]
MQNSLFIDVCRTNYNALLEMLGEIIELCPDELWDDKTDGPPFWQQLYHTIGYTDFYISESIESFEKPTFAEENAFDLTHDVKKAVSRKQMQKYLEVVKKHCNAALNNMTIEYLEGKNPFHWTGPTPAHRLVYNIRHTQHHIGWLNSILAKKIGKTAKWVI